MDRLKKTATVIETFLKIGFVFVIATGLGTVGMCVLAIVTQNPEGMPVNVLSIGGLQFGLAKDMMVKSTAVMVPTLIGALVSSLCYLYVIHQLHGIFKPMSKGSPFAKGASKYIRNIAFAQLVIGLAHTISDGAVSMAMFRNFSMDQLFLSDKISSCQLMVNLDMNFLWVFALLLLLSGIFRYGEQLQQQSDETL